MLAWTAARATRRLDLRPDVVEAPEWGAEALFMKRAARAPVIVQLHSPMYTLLRRRGKPLTGDQRLASMVERLAAKRADAVTAGAHVANEVSEGSTWLPSERIRIVPVPADRELLARSPGSWPRAPLLVACGRLDQLKAPEILIEAAARLVGDIPGLRVALIGEPDRRDAPHPHHDYGAWVAEVGRDLGVPVELLGRLPWPRAVDYYLAASVVVVPSRYETFSMVALEAMACATPVVVTSACGIAEHLDSLGPGWVVPPDDPAALAEALRPLLERPDFAASQGAQGRTFVRGRFSPTVAARARLELYDGLLGASRPFSAR
jgi:glycogen synthase